MYVLDWHLRKHVHTGDHPKVQLPEGAHRYLVHNHWLEGELYYLLLRSPSYEEGILALLGGSMLIDVSLSFVGDLLLCIVSNNTE